MRIGEAPPRYRLIIADDDAVVRSMLSMGLGEAFEVAGVAADGEAAVELAEKTQPDAALVDVDMPRGGGLRAVQGILDVSPKTAIVVLSGDESDATVRALVQAGAVTYCRKGIAPRALTETLARSVSAHTEERRRNAAEGNATATGNASPVTLVPPR